MIGLVLFYPFDTEFMVRALIASAILGVTAPLIGTFVVQRRLSLVGDGLGHVAAAGVGLALWFNFAPQTVALIATICAAIAIEWIFKVSKSADTALALIFYSGIAASITFAGQSSGQAQLQSFLFGSILSINSHDIIVLIIVCSVVCLVVIAMSRVLLALAVDENSAHIAGINTFAVRVIFMTAVACVVTISMSITGLLLISAVMVVPVMSARALYGSFLHAWIAACCIGLMGTIAGLALSGIADLAPGGVIVLTHISLFLLISLGARLRHHDHVHPNDELHMQPTLSTSEQK